MELLSAFDDAKSKANEMPTIRNLFNFMSAHFLTFHVVDVQLELQAL